MNSYSPSIIKSTTCAPNVPKDKGVRCSVFDTQANLLGRDASGSARRTLDNTGVQYGLAAFQSGKITAEQFVALNSPCLVYAECSNTVQGRRDVPLSRRPRLPRDEVTAYARKLGELAKWTAGQGMPLA